MTNLEKYRNELEPFVLSGIGWTIKEGKIVNCDDVYQDCFGCPFHNDEKWCALKKKDWLYQPAEKKVVDWSKVPVDTKVIIHFPCGDKKAYFSSYNPISQLVSTFINGQTSFTNDSNYSFWISETCELAEPNEEYMMEVEE